MSASTVPSPPSPSTHNTIATPSSRQLLAELHDALDAAEAAEARAIVLTHRGPAFCAGADLKERSSQGSTESDSNPFVDALVRLMDTARPTIAAVKGAVRAGGIGLMAACDLVVVDESTTFALTEVRIGVAPAIISVPILRRVAPSRIASAMLTGEPFDARRSSFDRPGHACQCRCRCHRRRPDGGDPRRRSRGRWRRPSGCSMRFP